MDLGHAMLMFYALIIAILFFIAVYFAKVINNYINR